MIFSLNNKLITKFYMFTISKKKNYSKEVILNIGDLLVFDKYFFHRSVVNKSYKAKLSCVISFYQKTE